MVASYFHSVRSARHLGSSAFSLFRSPISRLLLRYINAQRKKNEYASILLSYLRLRCQRTPPNDRDRLFVGSCMRSKYATAVYAAISAFFLILLPAVAAPVTERENRDCRGDYQRYCKEYQPGSEALRACMSRSRRKLSNLCVNALVDAGEMTRVQAAQLLHARRPTHKRSHKRAHKKH
jgi:hypothetical protein